jgi:hypothetical protein
MYCCGQVCLPLLSLNLLDRFVLCLLKRTRSIHRNSHVLILLPPLHLMVRKQYMRYISFRFVSVSSNNISFALQIMFQNETNNNNNNKSVVLVRCELYRPRHRRLSATLVPSFADRRFYVLSLTESYGRILGFLDRSRYFLFQVAHQFYWRRSQWPSCLGHELFSPAPTLRSWVRTHLGMDVCVCSVCVFSVSTVSSERASRPNKRLVRTYHWISLFNVIYKVSKLAYRIWVILIANKKSHKKESSTDEAESTPFQIYYFSQNLIESGIEAGPLDLQPGTLTTRPQRRWKWCSEINLLICQMNHVRIDSESDKLSSEYVCRFWKNIQNTDMNIYFEGFLSVKTMSTMYPKIAEWSSASGGFVLERVFVTRENILNIIKYKSMCMKTQLFAYYWDTGNS